jgi:hypothetical protein
MTFYAIAVVGELKNRRMTGLLDSWRNLRSGLPIFV